MKPIIDLSLLRSLTAFEQTGSLARAACQIGRTESAVSLQLKRLEELVGRKLLTRLGRRLVLTDDGYSTLHYARRMLAMNDELVLAVSPRPLAGKLRLAASQDFGDEILPRVLQHLSRRFPQASFEVEVEGGVLGLDRLEKGEVDAVLTIGLNGGPSAHRLQRVTLAWIGSSETAEPVGMPVPLVVFSQACRFKQCALAQLNKAGIQWEIVFKSPSLSGLWAATKANIGITVRSSYWVPAGLRVLNPTSANLPDLGDTTVDIHYYEDALTPDTLEMIQHVERSILLHPTVGNVQTSLTFGSGTSGGRKERHE